MNKADIFIGLTAALQAITAIIAVLVALRFMAYMDNTQQARAIWMKSIEADAKFQQEFKRDMEAICKALPGSERCGSQ